MFSPFIAFIDRIKVNIKKVFFKKKKSLENISTEWYQLTKITLFKISDAQVFTLFKVTDLGSGTSSFTITAWKVQSLVNQYSWLQLYHKDNRTLQATPWKGYWKV